MASGFHKLEMGKQGREVSEIRMALPLFMPKANAGSRTTTNQRPLARLFFLCFCLKTGTKTLIYCQLVVLVCGACAATAMRASAPCHAKRGLSV